MDDDIQERLQAGRFAEAFELLLERYRHRVFRLSCGLLRDDTMAEDLCQEAFLKIWRALPRFRGQASLSSWIYTITRNSCLTALKRQRDTLSLSDPATRESLEGRPELHAGVQPTGAELDVHALLALLPDHYRQVISLFYLEQKSYEEVAIMLGLPLGTVKTHLHRARKELLRLGTRHAATAETNLVPPPRS